MSMYTSIILFVSAMEEETLRIDEVNSFTNNGKNFQLIDFNNTSIFPDSFPRFIYAGTYKNFDKEGFLNHLSKKVKWEYPEYVQLFMQGEEDYNLNIYGNAGSKLLVEAVKMK